LLESSTVFASLMADKTHHWARMSVHLKFDLNQHNQGFRYYHILYEKCDVLEEDSESRPVDKGVDVKIFEERICCVFSVL